MQVFKDVSNFGVVQNNKPLIKTTNKLNKRTKATYISTFDFSY